MTIQEYLDTEDRYIKALYYILDYLDIKTVRVKNVVKSFGNETFQEIHKTHMQLYDEKIMEFYKNVEKLEQLEYKDIGTFCRLQLREDIGAKLKERLKTEGANQLLTDCHQLKMTAADGKKRLTDVADTAQLLRIIQSIPSPKAEPFKAWLAEVGKERIEETIDPELAIDRALETYQKKGYSDEWIHQRILSIRVRNNLTEEWDKRGVKKGLEYAILTDEISRAWSGMSICSPTRVCTFLLALIL